MPGGPLEISGGGSMADADVEVWLHSTPVLLGTIVADAFGDFHGTFTVPTSAPAGTHTVVASGIDPSGDPFEIRMTVTIAGLAPPETATDETPDQLLGFVLRLAALACLLAAAAAWPRPNAWARPPRPGSRRSP